MTTYPLIIDANSLIIRHIKATQLGDLKANGHFTGGVYGSLVTLTSLISGIDVQPDSIYMFFDSGVPAFRREAIPTYKMDRAKRKEELTPEEKEKCYRQLDEARRMFSDLGVVCTSFKNREADDCVGAAARLLGNRNPVVMSGDKDLWQVVPWGGPRVWDLSRKCMIDEDNFASVAGVPSSMWLVYRALVGDSSDSIPGAYGCGDKRATQLVLDVVDGGYDHDLDGVAAYLNDTAEADGKLRKFEDVILNELDRLKDVMRGISLWGSFGDTTRLEELLAKRPPVRKIPFLKFCNRLGLMSVVGAPDRFLKPFMRAADSRT